MRVAVLMWAVLFLANGAQAAPPTEVVRAQLVAVNVAGRQIVADGATWALSSTVKIAVPGKARASLRDLEPGMMVQLDVVGLEDPVPVVRSLTVLPD